MYEGLDTVVLYEELAYQDVVPFAWQPLAAPLTADEVNQIADRNLRLLQAYAALDEHGQVEKPDEKSPHSADILRLDMKMNLLLDLVGRILVASEPRPPALHVRFNALGAAWKPTQPSNLKVGDQGLLEIYLRDCLVDPLRLLAQVTNVGDDGIVKAKFHSTGDAIANLIEKLTFQRHRRQVADARQPRATDPMRASKPRK